MHLPDIIPAPESPRCGGDNTEHRDDGFTVVYVDHSAQLSGGELALLRTIPALTNTRPVVVLAENGPLVERLRSQAVQVIVLPLGVAGSIRKDSLFQIRNLILGVLGTARYVVRLRRCLKDLNPDIVHTNSLKSGIYGCLAARSLRIPAVWHLRDRLAPDYLSRPAIALTRTALRLLPTAVICNSLETRSTLPRTRAPSAVIPSPVIYDAHSIEPRRSRNKSLNAASFNVVMVGRLAPWKGQDLFIQAFTRALANTNAIALIVGSAMFGEQEYEREIRAQITELGMNEQIRMIGFREDVSEVFSNADLAVHASRSAEPFGQVVIEGMAAGVPVIAARAGGPSEVIDDGVNGVLFTPGSVEDLADAISRLYFDSDLRGRISAAGRERARDFTPATAASHMTDLYRLVRRTANPMTSWRES